MLLGNEWALGVGNYGPGTEGPDRDCSMRTGVEAGLGRKVQGIEMIPVSSIVISLLFDVSTCI